MHHRAGATHHRHHTGWYDASNATGTGAIDVCSSCSKKCRARTDATMLLINDRVTDWVDVPRLTVHDISLCCNCAKEPSCPVMHSGKRLKNVSRTDYSRQPAQCTEEERAQKAETTGIHHAHGTRLYYISTWHGATKTKWR